MPGIVSLSCLVPPRIDGELDEREHEDDERKHDAERTAVAVPAARVHHVHDVPHKGRYRRADARIAEVAVDEIGLDVDLHAADDGRDEHVEDGRIQLRHRDLPEDDPRVRAVDLRRLLIAFVHAAQPRHEQDDGAAQPLPDREDEDGRFAERRLAAQPVDIGVQHAVDRAVGIEQTVPHERDGDDARHGGDIVDDAERVGEPDIPAHADGEEHGEDHADGDADEIEHGIPQRCPEIRRVARHGDGRVVGAEHVLVPVKRILVAEGDVPEILEEVLTLIVGKRQDHGDDEGDVSEERCADDEEGNEDPSPEVLLPLHPVRSAFFPPRDRRRRFCGGAPLEDDRIFLQHKRSPFFRRSLSGRDGGLQIGFGDLIERHHIEIGRGRREGARLEIGRAELVIREIGVSSLFEVVGEQVISFVRGERTAPPCSVVGVRAGVIRIVDRSHADEKVSRRIVVRRHVEDAEGVVRPRLVVPEIQTAKIQIFYALIPTPRSKINIKSFVQASGFTISRAAFEANLNKSRCRA